MDHDCRTAKEKFEPEFVVCHNNDDVELASDPFADSQGLFSVKEEFIEPSFDEFNVNEVTVVQMKEDKPEVESDHVDYGYDAFDRDDDFSYDYEDEQLPPDTLKTELDEFHVKRSTDDFGTNWSSTEVNKNADDVENGEKIKNEPKANGVLESNAKTQAKSIDEKNICEMKGKKSSKIKGNKSSLATKEKTVDSKVDGVKKKGRPKSQGEHKCTYCGKSYAYASLLKLHTRTHMIDKGHNCPLCEKSFARADHCKQHINNVHKGEVVDGVVRKPSFERKCEICCKVFHHSGNLRKHMILHSGERPFSCDECGRTFVLAQHLKSHMKLVHSDEKSFQCFQCGKLFNHSGNYKKHMKVHSGERPFKCFCGKAFAQLV